MDETPELQSADYVAGKVWSQLLAAFPTNELLDNALAAQRMQAHYPGLITAYRPELSIYDDPLLALDLTKLVRVFFRAATISADGKLFGTDKIVHFIHLGRIYHSRYLSARNRGVAEAAAIAQTLVATSGNPLVSENWLLGMFTTGIVSNADLAADYAGLKFYRNLTEAIRIGNRVMPPMLVRNGPYWRLNDQVNPSSDFFTAFITPHWNEALNPNVYAAISQARIRALLKDRCPDVLDWYRDAQGRALTQEQFADIEAELSTFYGEDYGYQDAGESKVSIASTCFPPTVAQLDRRADCRHERRREPRGSVATSIAQPVRTQCPVVGGQRWTGRGRRASARGWRRPECAGHRRRQCAACRGPLGTRRSSGSPALTPGGSERKGPLRDDAIADCRTRKDNPTPSAHCCGTERIPTPATCLASRHCMRRQCAAAPSWSRCYWNMGAIPRPRTTAAGPRWTWRRRLETNGW